MIDMPTKYARTRFTARIVSENEDLDRLVLAINYQGPLGNACIELPSGLMKEGATPEQLSTREPPQPPEKGIIYAE
eukprot:CFRG6564T1